MSEATQSLLRDIFRGADLFADAPRIRRRMVLWGNHAEVLDLPHSGLVVAEGELLERLWQQTPVQEAPAVPSSKQARGWSLVSTSGVAKLPPPQSFGARQASVVQVALSAAAAHDCCWVESLADGWLFLLPAGEGRGTLISTGYAPEGLLEKSRLVALQICRVASDAAARTFAAFPQTLSALCGRDWLACGSAAMTFDPLCGEGAGHAARQALLVAAILRASQRGEPSANLLAHYSDRLLHGFLRHLQICLPYYRTGGVSHFWKNETASLECGIRWLQNRLYSRDTFKYRFSGYDLEPIGEAQGALQARQ